LEQVGNLVDTFRSYCEEHQLLGRILIAEEGINAAVSGTINNITAFKQWIEQYFPALTFREQDVTTQVYHKLVVRKREEIVSFGYDVDLKNTAPHITPKELKTTLDNNEDVLLLDARNKYESHVGKFKGALTLPINTFRDFPKHLHKINNKKQTKIIMYCTGGVRCEKSSALLKEEGFENVHQLEGGIINYVNQYPNTHYEGGCFVFDDRIVSHISGGKPVVNCTHCDVPSEDYYNCHNLDCDKLFIACTTCAKEHEITCSQECHKAARQRTTPINESIQIHSTQ